MISWCTHEFTPACIHWKLLKTKKWMKRSQCGCFVSTCFYIILLEYHGPILWTVTKAAPGCIKYAGRCVEWGKGSMLDMSPRPASISWPQALHRSSCEDLYPVDMFQEDSRVQNWKIKTSGTANHGVPQQYLSVWRDSLELAKKKPPCNWDLFKLIRYLLTDPSFHQPPSFR